jgi:agmatinase
VSCHGEQPIFSHHLAFHDALRHSNGAFERSFVVTHHYGSDHAFTGAKKGSIIEPTFSGALSFMRRLYSKDVSGCDAVVWGVPYDCVTTMRAGTRFGPAAIRAASAQFCPGDTQYPRNNDPFETLAMVDFGDCIIDHMRPQDAHASIEAQASAILAKAPQLITLGGDHSITLPLLRAHAKKHGPMALVHFDSHQDTWAADDGLISHGNFVTHAVAEGLIDVKHSVQIGIRTTAPDDFNIRIIDAYQMADLGIAGVITEIKRIVGGMQAYLTFDIDCLDPAFAPGTGTPVSGGPTAREALMILDRILDQIDFIGMDIVEVSPPYDHAEMTSIAASTVPQHYLQALATKKARI